MRFKIPSMMSAAMVGAAFVGSFGQLSGQELEGLPSPDPLREEIRVDAPPVDLYVAQDDESDIETLTRGPLHEAFAEPIAATPGPGIVISREPPIAINEQAPDYRPEGESAIWISGYWGWDDERSDFLWISGVYRVPPEGYRWVPGYWNAVEGGWQWVQGFWIPEVNESIEYLAPPPESLEVGPSSPAPGSEFFYIPGYWSQANTSYQWNAGYWHPLRDDYVWVPCHYVWTPRGCVYVDGYWDRRLPLRGLCFAPVTIANYSSLRPGWAYRPRVVLNAQLLLQHLFVRPRYNHYLFGDYYAMGPSRRDVLPAYMYHQSRGGFDPLISFYTAYNARQGQDMMRWYGNHHAELQRNPSMRPPRIWSARVDSSEAGALSNHLKVPDMAHRIEHLAKQPRENRIAPVNLDLKQELVKRNDDFRKIAKERESLERRNDLTKLPNMDRSNNLKLTLPKLDNVIQGGQPLKRTTMPDRPQRTEMGSTRITPSTPLPNLNELGRSRGVPGTTPNLDRGRRPDGLDNNRLQPNSLDSVNRLQNPLKLPQGQLPDFGRNPNARTERPERIERPNTQSPLRDLNSAVQQLDPRNRKESSPTPRTLEPVVRGSEPTRNPQKIEVPRPSPKPDTKPNVKRGPDKTSFTPTPNLSEPVRSANRANKSPTPNPTPIRIPERVDPPKLQTRTEPIRSQLNSDIGQAAGRIRGSLPGANIPGNATISGNATPRNSIPSVQPRSNSNERRSNGGNPGGGENGKSKKNGPK